MVTDAQRTKAGKPATGTVLLRAYHQAGKVHISIRDDGAGIDAVKLKEKAASCGLITPEQAAEMGDREALQLIFHPGFSMAKQVTGVSGRGVGMDVVKTNIEKLGGAVGIDTEVGKGTTINVKLPLTLAIVPSLIVRCGNRRFAIPQTNIRELVRIQKKDAATRIEHVKDAEVFRLRGKLLPLVRLNNSLGVDKKGEAEGASAINIIVVEAGHLQYGLIVDGLHDSEEIVVKPLGRHMQECHTLAGATILGDGQIALILDVTGIAAHCELALPEDDALSEYDESSADAGAETQASLLFTNHADEQFGVPMEVISRLERVRSDQIDSVGGLEVLQYRGVSLPLLALEKYIRAKPRAESQKVYVVVFSVLNREVGLIVPHLIDIRQISTQVDMITFREPGVIGSVEVGEKATRLVDLYELTKLARPEWFTEVEPAAVTTSSKSSSSKSSSSKSSSSKSSSSESSQPQHVTTRPRILLAEDSSFVRHQVTGYMEQAGYEVVGCEDGQIAWDVLQESGGEVDLVVTDIEMPNMDGCQLARHITNDPNLAHLRIAGTARYHCPSQEKEGDHTQCQSLPTDVLDQLIGIQVLKAVEPSALELSRKAATDIEQERRRLHKNWRQQLERAKYEVQRARRQYDTVDPENRLVAAELERQWEATLREQCNLQDEYDREGKTRPAELTPEEHRQIETLSTDLPSLWNDASTSAVDRQEVVRCLIEKIIVNARGQTEMVDVEVHWCGGYVSHHEIRRPVGRYEFLVDFERMKTRIIELRGEGQTAGDIANALNAEGYYPPRQRQKFNAVMIRMLIKRLRLNSSRADAVNAGTRMSWCVNRLALVKRPAHRIQE